MRVKNLYSWNNMLSGYASNGMVRAAKRLFDKMPKKDYMSWNTMVMAYVQSGCFDEALRCYMELRRLGIGYNEYSFAGVLTACVKLRELWLARILHCQILLVGFLSNVVLLSSIMDAYAKCGEIRHARRLFDETRQRDVLAWTTLVSGYAQGGDMKLARDIFDAKPDKNSVSWTALITGLQDAKRVFDTVENKQHIVVWNAMISVLIDLGCGKLSTKMFVDMVIIGVKPDKDTFVFLLNACNRSIFVQEGLHLFESMMGKYNIIPNHEHYACLIDLLGRPGFFDQLMNIPKKMPQYNTIPDDRVWKAVIGVCRIHGNIELGKTIAKHLVQIEPQLHVAYLLLSGVYAAVGRWVSAEEVRKFVKDKDIGKEEALP